MDRGVGLSCSCFVCRGRIDIRPPWTQTKDKLSGLLKKTDEGRLRQANSSFPCRTWWREILCLSQEPACGSEAALTGTMVAWRVVCCAESVVTNAGGNGWAEIVVEYVLVETRIQISVFRVNRIAKLLSSQTRRPRSDDCAACAFAG